MTESTLCDKITQTFLCESCLYLAEKYATTRGMEFYVNLIHCGELYILALKTPPTFQQLQNLAAQITTDQVVLTSDKTRITDDTTLRAAITNGCLVVNLEAA